MFELFQTFLYQPFFNLLLIIYWFLNLIPSFDATMGHAVIVLTIVIRIILLPISLAAHRSEKERRAISAEIEDVETKYKDNPVESKLAVKQIFRKNRRVVVAELISFSIQFGISMILWMVFSKGLVEQSNTLVYSFVPRVFPLPPEKLMFMGFTLFEPHWQLNVIQSILILILETLGAYISAYPVSRREVVRMQFTLPIVSFMIFAFLPAGKKLFVITTLVFSIILNLILAIWKKIYELQEKLELKDAQAANPGEDTVVVEVK